MSQNENTESLLEKITETITSSYKSFHKFSNLNSSAEYRQCKNLRKFDQRKMDYKTLSEQYRTHQKDLFQDFLRTRRSDNLEDSPSVKKLFGGKNVETTWIELKKNIAIMACCSQHSVPINFFDYPCLRWATEFKCSNDTVRWEIVKIYDELRPDILKSLSKCSFLIAFGALCFVALCFKSSPGRALLSGKAW